MEPFILDLSLLLLKWPLLVLLSKNETNIRAAILDGSEIIKLQNSKFWKILKKKLNKKIEKRSNNIEMW